MVSHDSWRSLPALAELKSEGGIFDRHTSCNSSHMSSTTTAVLMSLACVLTPDRGLGDISSEDSPSQARSALVLNAIVLQSSHGEVPSRRPSAFPSISLALTRNANRKSGNPVTAQNFNGQMPNDTTTAVQHRPKAHLGRPTTSWLRPSSFDKPSCRSVGQ